MAEQYNDRNRAQSIRMSDEREDCTSEDKQHPCGEMTAAAALTSLVDSPHRKDDEDHDHDHDDDDDDCDEEGFNIPQRYTRSGRKRAVSFPLKLMKVLSDKMYHDVITWMPSGKSFNIINSKRFVAEILPEHFKSAKYSSFTRKLHRWGFVRHYRGEEAGAFYHSEFQKGRFDLVEKMTCYKQDPPKAAAPTPKSNFVAAPSVPTNKVAEAPLPVTRAPVRHSLPNVSRLQPEVTAPMASAANGGLDVCSDLNVAIELEVARRLRERLDAAALTRAQAFALIQQRQDQQLLQQQERQLLQQQQERQLLQQQERQILQQQERQLLQQQQHQQQDQLKGSLFAPVLVRPQTHLPWSQQGISLLKRSMMQPIGRQEIMPQGFKPLLYPARASNLDIPPFQAMPQTNIYGAKTA